MAGEPNTSRSIEDAEDYTCDETAGLEKLIDIRTVERHLGGTIDQVLVLTKGYLNRKFLLRSGDSHYVLKIYSDVLSFVSPKLDSEGRARAEYQALKICQSNDLGAPRPVGLFGNAVIMTQLHGTDLTDLPLTKALISLIVSWLIKFHSIEVSSNLLDIGVVNAPLLGAFKNLGKYISTNPDDTLARELEDLLLENHSRPFPDSLVLLRGDPTLGNWLIEGTQIYGLDFEFFSAGNPLFEVGLLAASIVDRGKFTQASYELCRYALMQYRKHNSSVSFTDIRLGVLCGLILIAVSVPNPERCQRIFGHTRKTLTWIENIEER